MDLKELNLIKTIIQQTVNESLAQLYLEIADLLKEEKKNNDKFKKIVLESIKKNTLMVESNVGKKIPINNQYSQVQNQQVVHQINNVQKKKYTGNSLINDILNQTRGFTKAEMSEEPGNETTITADQYISEGKAVGIGNEVIDLNEKTVAVLEATQKNYSDVLKRMSESANQTRGSVNLSALKNIKFEEPEYIPDITELKPGIVSQKDIPAHLLG